jgi:hypothetical protein
MVLGSLNQRDAAFFQCIPDSGTASTAHKRSTACSADYHRRKLHASGHFLEQGRTPLLSSKRNTERGSCHESFTLTPLLRLLETTKGVQQILLWLSQIAALMDDRIW